MNAVKRLVSLVPLLTLLHLAGMADAARNPEDPFKDWEGEDEAEQYKFDESLVDPWQESATELPPLPAEEDLLRVQLDSLPKQLTAYMGARSLSLDANDRVLRYWLVITSPSGAYNATYEGLLCDTREYKIYAYGNPRRSSPIQAATGADWRPVGRVRPGTFRPEMMRTLLCNDSSQPRPPSEILAILRGQAPYRAPSDDTYDY